MLKVNFSENSNIPQIAPDSYGLGIFLSIPLEDSQFRPINRYIYRGVTFAECGTLRNFQKFEIFKNLGAKNHYAATIIGDCLSNQNAKEFYKFLGLEDESELDSQPPTKKKKVAQHR